ncbi:MAG: ribosome silencing factor [Acutalibacteraceae bacterium]|nr:ribosome silencing factor [Acutalibacteraceae bacterium]
MTSLETAKNIVKILDNKKAMDLELIETKELTIVSDYFIIASGTSNTHVRALADEVEEEMKKLGVEPDHIEGRATGWILLDYGCVLVHVFDPQSREYYNLDRLWGDAAKIDISDIVTPD